MLLVAGASIFLLSSAVSPDVDDYGKIYFEETSSRIAPRLHLGVGYGREISNSLLDMNSLNLTAETRVWKYFSTGLFGHIISVEDSSAGEALRNLRSVDIQTKIAEPRWGLFSLSSFQLMVGQWNLINLIPVRADLVLGGGAGFLQRRDDQNAPSHAEFSYLWSIEQRLRFYSNWGIFVSLFGHTDGNFLQAGVYVSYD